MEPLLVQTAEAGPRVWPTVVTALGVVGVGGLIWILTTWSRGGNRRERRLLGRAAGPGDYAEWNDPSFWSEEAEQAFARARRRARREVLAGRLRRRDTCLLSFDDVIGRRRYLTASDRELRTVPISKILGSVDKPCSFTRSFNPMSEELRDRWKRGYAVAKGLRGYQPVDLYQVGEAFFVVDGHFRVSVARFLGGESMRAYVQEWT